MTTQQQAIGRRSGRTRRRSRASLVIAAAMAANLVIMASKYVAATLTGSSAMLSEAVHSTVDSLDGIFLMIGRRRSRMPPDEQHPFGHGKALYFWSLIVSIFVFAAGGGISLYEGVSRVMAPHEIRSIKWNYAVLAIAFASEFFSYRVALREVRAHARGRGLWRAIRTSKDPIAITVVLEDAAALTGLVIAGLGLCLGRVLDWPRLDGVASILIAIVLFVTALVLARESAALLVGEGVDRTRLHAIRRHVLAAPAVDRIDRLQTMHLGPDEVLLTMEVTLARGHDGAIQAIDRLERSLHECFPELRQIYIKPSPCSAPAA